MFFFIDPEILNDRTMDNVHEITLSYTFFKTGEEDAIQVSRATSRAWQAGKQAGQCCLSVRRHVARTRLIRRLFTRETKSGVDVYFLPC